jgi:hypothetical protein
MSLQSVSDFAGRTFRAGSAYDLVVFDRLPIEEQIVLAELRADPNTYGVFRPRAGSGRTFRAVTRDMALLWLTLREPGPLPFFVWSGEEEAAAKAISALVLDGVLEIEEAGHFVSGSAAAALLVGTSQAPAERRLAILSQQALWYGQALRLNDPTRLALRLYNFGRQPVTPAWHRRAADEDSVLAYLGAAPGTDLARRLNTHWEKGTAPEPSGWIVWSKTGKREARNSRPTCKLYLSPVASALPDVFPILVETLERRDGAHFKVGRTADGLLRPDKLVVYVDTLEALQDIAHELSKKLAGVEPHGVPFSAEIGGDGLLSWGLDPPRAQRTLSWQEPESWRLWVVQRLAAAMVAAQADERPGLPPWQFAVERLRREGVDVDRWTPSASIWNVA